jgi:threonine/homoserine/homoserine lactone efflux protein
MLLQAYLLGWAVAAPIGPVNLEIIRRSLRHRLAAGLCVGLGATTADTIYMLATSFGLSRFLRTPAVLLVCFVVGGALLGWLAFLAGRDAWRYLRGTADPLPSFDKVPAGEGPPAGGGTRVSLPRHYLLGVGITLTNPMTLVFWMTIAGQLFPGRIPGAGEIVQATLFVWLGTISWVLTLMALLTAGRRWIGPRLFGTISLLGGVAMTWFALRFWWLALHLETLAGG